MSVVVIVIGFFGAGKADYDYDYDYDSDYEEQCRFARNAVDLEAFRLLEGLEKGAKRIGRQSPS